MNTSVHETPNTPKKKKKNGRFNLIDLLLVLVVLALIAALLYVFAPFSAVKNLLSSEDKTIEYTVELLGVDKDDIGKIMENNVVVDAISKSQLGTVRVADYNYQYTVLQYVQKDDKAEGVLAEHPDKCNVLITISATAEYAQGEGYVVNQCRIAVGEKMQLIFPNYMGEGYCIDLNVVS